MPASFSFGEIQLNVSLDDSPAQSPRDAESPFLLLVAADFSGRTNRGVIESMAGRRPVHIDCDNFEKAMARLGGTLRLPSARPGGPAVVLRIETVEDFHPDNLVKQVDSLEALLQTRRRLQSPATAADVLVDAERVGDRIGEQGLMALLSVKGRGAVRLASLQSVTLPAQPLALRRG
jgi:type VI secretion system protein ImpB